MATAKGFFGNPIFKPESSGESILRSVHLDPDQVRYDKTRFKKRLCVNNHPKISARESILLGLRRQIVVDWRSGTPLLVWLR